MASKKNLKESKTLSPFQICGSVDPQPRASERTKGQKRRLELKEAKN
jgi:hypothetical protein